MRGIRNIPCETKPWKRAPTVQMCESDEQYVPLNDGNNWKGDPNATLSGQDVPAPRPPTTIPLPMPPQTVPQFAPPPLAGAAYDPATGGVRGTRRKDLQPSRSRRPARTPRRGNPCSPQLADRTRKLDVPSHEASDHVKSQPPGQSA